jgi:signal peptidase II
MTKINDYKKGRHGEEQPQAASRTTQSPATAYVIAVAVIVLDQLAKWWMLTRQFPAACAGFSSQPGLLSDCSVSVAPVFKLTMVWNYGVSFGLLRAGQDWVRWALVVFSVGVAIFLAVWARKIERPLLMAAVGLVMGGAVGNAIDRARFGAVADFLDFKALYFPWVFNVADSAITVGVVLLLLDSFRRDAKS